MKTFTRVRTIAFLLRVVAVSAILSGISFFFPERWIDAFLAWCDLVEPMPHAVLMRYVLWGAGNLQVGISLVIWVIARDVVRYQSVVIAVLVVFLIAAPAFYLTNALAGLPATGASSTSLAVFWQVASLLHSACGLNENISRRGAPVSK